MFDKTAGLLYGAAISTSATSQLVDFHSFFAFNALSGMTGPIVSATLSLYNPAGGHSSSETSEMLTIDGFSGNLSTLEAGGRVPGECNALASGTVFATQSVSVANNKERLRNRLSEREHRQSVRLRRVSGWDPS
jgi:hypothetical protein